MLRATTACNFSSLIWPAGSAPAALASLLFDPPEPQIIGKTQWIATFYFFAHLHLLSSYSFSSTLLSNLSLLSASSLLCFSSVHIVGSLTSKLPSMMRVDESYSMDHLYHILDLNQLHPDDATWILDQLPGHSTQIRLIPAQGTGSWMAAWRIDCRILENW